METGNRIGEVDLQMVARELGVSIAAEVGIEVYHRRKIRMETVMTIRVELSVKRCLKRILVSNKALLSRDVKTRQKSVKLAVRSLLSLFMLATCHTVSTRNNLRKPSENSEKFCIQV